MHKTVVINVVGLTRSLISRENTPRLHALAERGNVAAIGSVIPAVTTTVQATYLTGTLPSEHGIVGNGWYFRDECEVKFWRQSNKLVQRPSVWDAAKRIDPSFTSANMFWWYNMYTTADISVTPRPMYPADGRKLPDVYSNPPSLRDELQQELGQFPLFKFWGPATSVESSRWIADASIRVDRKFNPTLTLIYLPHLDYELQRVGPELSKIGKDLREIDGVVGNLLDHFEQRKARVIVLSEYGIAHVNKPVHLNRVLRENGLVAVREELGHELLDAGASAAFAVADHQVAHVYVNDPSRLDEVRRLLEATPGVERVLGDVGKHEIGLDHPRSGELIAIAAPNAWFTYYYWLDDDRAPDFATTVDIHRKPGYDPAELFVDPTLPAPKLKIAAMLVRKKLGFRTMLKVIPTDATLVRGSHGRPAMSDAEAPVLITDRGLEARSHVPATDVHSLILRHLTN
jgi:predicted AlkP superfamily pyrophosphatase or phosphodiesterase